jgi:hypothetical protein
MFQPNLPSSFKVKNLQANVNCFLLITSGEHSRPRPAALHIELNPELFTVRHAVKIAKLYGRKDVTNAS